MTGHFPGSDFGRLQSERTDVASGSIDTSVRVWDVASGRQRRVLTGHTGGVDSVRFSPDGETLVSGSVDTTVRLWNVASGEELAALVAIDDKDWIATTPEGFFDGSPGGWQKILFRFNDNTFDTAEPEQFFNDFYQPGLLQDVLKYHKPLRDLCKSGAIQSFIHPRPGRIAVFPPWPL